MAVTDVLRRTLVSSGTTVTNYVRGAAFLEWLITVRDRFRLGELDTGRNTQFYPVNFGPFI